MAGAVTDPAAESNHAAYPAVGVWHELLVTGDEAFAAAMWPTVRRGDRVRARPADRARRDRLGADGSTAAPARYALLTGCSSMHQGLRCAIALAEYLGEPQPDWELAADQLGHVVACHPEAFADKSRFSMDWYYPVLGGPVRGAAGRERLAAGWDTFVVPGLGVRCVSDQPWVTGAETCELVLALDASATAPGRLELFGDIQHLRDPRRGVLDRLAVRQPGALPGRAEQLDRGRDHPGRRRAVRGDRRVGNLHAASRRPAARRGGRLRCGWRPPCRLRRSADAGPGPLQHP